MMIQGTVIVHRFTAEALLLLACRSRWSGKDRACDNRHKLIHGKDLCQ